MKVILIILGTVLLSPAGAALADGVRPLSETEISSRIAEIEGSSKTSAWKADELSDLGEKALSDPGSFLFSLKPFEKAFEMNPNNPRANFYTGVLKPFFMLKGFLWRLDPLLPEIVKKELPWHLRSGGGQQFIYHYISDIDQKLSQFKTMKEVQIFLREELLPILKESQKRIHLAETKAEFITGSVTVALARKKGKGLKEYSYRFDALDAYSMRMIYAGVAIFIKIFSAYELDPIALLSDMWIKDRKKMTAEKAISDMKKYPTFLTLHPWGKKELSSVVDDLGDGIEGLKILSTLLYRAKSREENMIKPITGEFLSYLMKVLVTAADLLSGPTPIEIPDSKNTKIIVNVPAILLNNPIKDLKKLFPMKFEDNGRRATDFPDPTFDGLFPEGKMDSKRLETLLKAIK